MLCRECGDYESDCNYCHCCWDCCDCNVNDFDADELGLDPEEDSDDGAA